MNGNHTFQVGYFSLHSLSRYETIYEIILQIIQTYHFNWITAFIYFNFVLFTWIAAWCTTACIQWSLSKWPDCNLETRALLSWSLHNRPRWVEGPSLHWLFSKLTKIGPKIYLCVPCVQIWQKIQQEVF